MIKNQALHDLLASHGAVMRPTSEQAHLRMHARQATKLLERKSLEKLQELSRKENARIIERVTSDDQSRFAGGSCEDAVLMFTKGVDISAHEAALKRFDKSGVGQKLRAEILASSPRRKLRLSDEDGDFDFARRFDEKFFVESYKAPKPTRIVEVYCGFSFSAFVKKSEIDAYGAFVWSVCRLLESAGVQTRIVYASGSVDASTSGGPKEGLVEIDVKSPGEYVSPQVLAATFSSLFFRRTLFVLDVLKEELIGSTCSGGLGAPRTQGKKLIEFKNGRLILNGDPSGDTESTVTEILKAFKNERTNP